MLRSVHEFAGKLKSAGPNAMGFLYYSGHGIASAGENYLIPVDVDGASTLELSLQGVKHSEVLAILRGEAPAAHVTRCARRQGLPSSWSAEWRAAGLRCELGKTASDLGLLSLWN